MVEYFATAPGALVLPIVLFLFSLAGSYFASNPRILYVGALGVCILVFYCTHLLIVYLERTLPTPIATAEPRAEDSQRAWVNIENQENPNLFTQLSWNDGRSVRFIANLILHNAGRRPATKVRLIFARKWSSESHPQVSLPTGWFEGDQSQEFVLGPDEKKSLSFDLCDYKGPLSPVSLPAPTMDQVRHVQLGKGSLQVGFGVTYLNGFAKLGRTWKVFNLDSKLGTFVLAGSDQE